MMNGLKLKTRETATSSLYTRRHREHFNVRNVNFSKDVMVRFNIEPLMEDSLDI